MSMTLEIFESMMETQLRTSKKILYNWNESFSENPTHAMSWSMNTFKAAAQHDVAKRILHSIKEFRGDNVSDEKILSDIKTITNENVIRGAMYPERSSSPASNLMSQEEVSAWASIAYQLNR